MSHEQDPNENRGFKVEDRRRFSESGDARPEVVERSEPSSPPPAAADAPPDPATTGHPPMEMTFSTFLISLSTQALAHLGEIPHPVDGQMAADLGAAKQLIDILGMLQVKTHGNLDQAEAALLEHALYDLRLKFVERVRSQRHPAPR